jgi:hypothetical protein
MRPHTLFLSAALITGPATAAAADQPIAQPVDLALVLLTDVSHSMDDREYRMVKDGYKAAFADPEVVRAILNNSKGVAVAYVEFSGTSEFTVVKGWDVLTDSAPHARSAMRSRSRRAPAPETPRLRPASRRRWRC